MDDFDKIWALDAKERFKYVFDAIQELKALTKSKRSKIFIIPTEQQIEAYGKSIGFDISGEDFLNHYNMCGWVAGVSRKPIKDWEACVRTWKRNNKKKELETVPQAPKPSSYKIKVGCTDCGWTGEIDKPNKTHLCLISCPHCKKPFLEEI